MSKTSIQINRLHVELTDICWQLSWLRLIITLLWPSPPRRKSRILDVIFRGTTAYYAVPWSPYRFRQLTIQPGHSRTGSHRRQGLERSTMTRVLPPAAKGRELSAPIQYPRKRGLHQPGYVVSAKSRIIRAGLSVANTLTSGHHHLLTR